MKEGGGRWGEVLLEPTANLALPSQMHNSVFLSQQPALRRGSASPQPYEPRLHSLLLLLPATAPRRSFSLPVVVFLLLLIMIYSTRGRPPPSPLPPRVGHIGGDVFVLVIVQPQNLARGDADDIGAGLSE